MTQTLKQLWPTTTYVGALANDLDKLLATACAMRSIEEVDMERWLCGKDDLIKRTPNPHPDDLRYLGQPVSGSENEYSVRAPSGEEFRFLVQPRFSAEGVQNNLVRVKYTKTHAEGRNETIGEKVQSEDHDVLYLLPWVARLPVSDVSYDSVVQFFEKNNGFRVTTKNQNISVFQDVYNRPHKEVTKESPLIIHGQHSKRYTAVQEVTDKVDVYVTIESVKMPEGKAVKLTLEVEVPRKQLCYRQSARATKVRGTRAGQVKADDEESYTNSREF